MLCGVDDGGEVRRPRRSARPGESRGLESRHRPGSDGRAAPHRRGIARSRIIEGPPGSAKTLLARAVAHMLGASFKRIQFTPDTTPAELNGSNTIRAGEHVFLPGAVFTNVLLADEINRTPPRTQAALFEPMQERQVTVDGKAHKLPDPFLVIATQNPHEHEGVFPLPEGQLDRFLFKITLEYADADSELQMLNLPHNGIAPDMLGEVRPLLGVVGLDKARQELEHTEVPSPSGATSSRSAVERVSSPASSSEELARHDPPRERDEGERPPERAHDRHDRGRSRDGALRPPASHRRERRHERVDTVLLDAMASVPTAVPPPVAPVP